MQRPQICVAGNGGCQDYGIHVTWRPPGTPRYGGHIDRVMATQMAAVHVREGSTGTSIPDWPARDAQLIASHWRWPDSLSPKAMSGATSCVASSGITTPVTASSSGGSLELRFQHTSIIAR